jgi:hypothetical protein
MFNWGTFLLVLEIAGAIVGLISAVLTIYTFITKQRKLAYVLTCVTLVCIVLVALLASYTPETRPNVAGPVRISPTATGSPTSIVAPTSTSTSPPIVPTRPPQSIPTAALAPVANWDAQQTDSGNPCLLNQSFPVTMHFSLHNTGSPDAVTIPWSVSSNESGWSFSPQSGTLTPGNTVYITVTVPQAYPTDDVNVSFDCSSGCPGRASSGWGCSTWPQS